MSDSNYVTEISAALLSLRNEMGIDLLPEVMEALEAGYDRECNARNYVQANMLYGLHRALSHFYTPPPDKVSGEPVVFIDIPYQPVWMSERELNRLRWIQKSGLYDLEDGNQLSDIGQAIIDATSALESES